MDFLSVLTFLSMLYWTSDGSSEWGYSGADGPSDWPEHYPDCGGEKQSPINIDTNTAKYDSDLEMFDFSGYDVPNNEFNMTLQNYQGHSAKVFYAGNHLHLKGGSLPGTYKLEQFHFHWGKKDERGSEHAKDNTFFPMEMHLVHTGNDPVYSLAVVGFWFKIGELNENMNKLLEYFHHIVQPDVPFQIPSFPLTDILPDPGSMNYYRYGGSLTTPPCTENALWTVASTTLEVSESQMEKFRMLIASGTEHIGDNFRPLQALNDRKVTTTIDPKASGLKDAGQALSANALTLFLAAILLLLNRIC